jgi:hypothetical protein
MKKTLSSIKLNKIKPSERFLVQKIPEAKIPFGPVVIQKDLQEIAIGGKFASLIEVSQEN